MKPIDSHCHIQFKQFDHDREKIIDRIEKELDFVVLAGCSEEDNKKTLRSQKLSDSLKYCLGLHPLYNNNSNIDEVEKQIKENHPLAIGEIGLDYNYITKKTEREKSKEIFNQMLENAEKEGLPAVIHSRNAEQECFEIVRNYELKAFFHCFNGEPDLAEKIVSEGHYIGITSQILHSKRVKNIAEKIRIKDILTETDSPFLGQKDRNSPLNVTKVIEKISEVKNIDKSEVSEITSNNSREFFGV